MPGLRKKEYGKQVVQMVSKYGIGETSRRLGKAKSTIHEVYHRYKALGLSTTRRLTRGSGLVK